MRTIQLFNFVKKHTLELVVTLIVAFSIIIGGTFSWFALIQSTTNEFIYDPSVLRLVKYEEGTEIPLPGAIFDLYDENDTYIGRYETDEKGEIRVDILDKDKQYYFREYQAPPGYRLPDGENRDTPLMKPGTEPVIVYNTRQNTFLLITKKVSGDGADTEKRFGFTVRIGEQVYRITLAGGEEYRFTNIPLGTAYEVTETDAEGYIITSSGSTGTTQMGGNTAHFLNTGNLPPDTPVGSLVIQKIVSGFLLDTTRQFRFIVGIGDVEYELYLRPGERKTFENIPVGTPYYVIEDDYSGEQYATSSDHDSGTIRKGTTTAVFRNHYEGQEVPPTGPDTVVLSGRKHWVHGSNPPESQPKSVTLYVVSGSAVVAQKQVTAEDGWRYAFRLPRYDATGAEISYRISEAEVPGYVPSANGYSLTNTYVEPGDLEVPDLPQTGDRSNIVFWIVLMLISGLMLVLLLRKYRRR